VFVDVPTQINNEQNREIASQKESALVSIAPGKIFPYVSWNELTGESVSILPGWNPLCIPHRAVFDI
jgi:hypothetical protein